MRRRNIGEEVATRKLMPELLESDSSEKKRVVLRGRIRRGGSAAGGRRCLGFLEKRVTSLASQRVERKRQRNWTHTTQSQ